MKLSERLLELKRRALLRIGTKTHFRFQSLASVTRETLFPPCLQSPDFRTERTAARH